MWDLLDDTPGNRGVHGGDGLASLMSFLTLGYPGSIPGTSTWRSIMLRHKNWEPLGIGYLLNGHSPGAYNLFPVVIF